MTAYRVTRTRHSQPFGVTAPDEWDWFVVDADDTAHGIESREDLDQLLGASRIRWQDLDHRRLPGLFSEDDTRHATEQLVAFKRHFKLEDDR